MRQDSKQQASHRVTNALLKELIEKHDSWERETEAGPRLDKLEGHYEVLNREMGEVVGKLSGIDSRLATIQWFVGGTMLAAAGALVKLLLGV